MKTLALAKLDSLCLQSSSVHARPANIGDSFKTCPVRRATFRGRLWQLHQLYRPGAAVSLIELSYRLRSRA